MTIRINLKKKYSYSIVILLLFTKSNNTRTGEVLKYLLEKEANVTFHVGAVLITEIQENH